MPEAWHGRKHLRDGRLLQRRPARESTTRSRRSGRSAIPVFDLLHEQPYVELQSYLDETEPKGATTTGRRSTLAELSDDLLETVGDLSAECPIPEAELGFLHLGGALNERASDDGAVGNRDARYAMGAHGMWQPDEPRPTRSGIGSATAWQRLRPSPPAELRQLPDRRRGRRARSGRRTARTSSGCVEIKQNYDPDEPVPLNRNIAPTA